MRFSTGAASLLTAVFTFRAKLLVGAADIFDPLDPTPDVDAADAGVLSHGELLLAIKEGKKKCQPGDGDCIHGKHRAPINSDAANTAASGTDLTPTSSEISISASSCAEHIECVDGYRAGGGPLTTCYAACAGSCCTSTVFPYDACVGFTGKVCKDGKSCNGFRACEEATIPYVVNSCIGDLSCTAAGQGGLIGSITDSCEGYRACIVAAYFGGSVGSITSSCNGYDACNFLGYNHGKVGNVVDSCFGDGACENGGAYFGSTGSITSSCDGENACFGLGSHVGAVGNVNNACTATYSCYNGGADGGIIGNIANSCTSKRSCASLGRGDGKAGHVTNSCDGVNACQFAGFNRGSIGSISQSCNAYEACQSAGSGKSGAITSNLQGCCNTVEGCESATQKTLPAQCTSKVRMCVVSCSKTGSEYVLVVQILCSTVPTANFCNVRLRRDAHEP
jgi:hypothetical protein